MKEHDFDNLVESIKQAGRIRRGEMKAGRIFEFYPVTIKESWSYLELSGDDLNQSLIFEEC
uniref:hypothetical protein n=1 Tax=Candidatus Electronema sp. TaxID=2698783 RepID=UPI004056DC6C